jgi:hypothetical protein
MARGSPALTCQLEAKEKQHTHGTLAIHEGNPALAQRPDPAEPGSSTPPMADLEEQALLPRSSKSLTYGNVSAGRASSDSSCTVLSLGLE